MQLNQKYSFTGSSDYSFNSIRVPGNGIALFNTESGIGGVNFFPANGNTVTVVAGYEIDRVQEDLVRFSTDFNNYIFYLVSNIQYNQSNIDEIISLATSVPVSFVAGPPARYEGTFVFNNPNNLPYLYLVFDNRDKLLTTITHTGSFLQRAVSVDFGQDRGISELTYSTTNKPVRYQLYWNNILVEDTGYVGLNSTTNYNSLIAIGIDAQDINLTTPLDGLVNNGSGTISFNKFTEEPQGYLFLYAPLPSTSFSVTKVLPSLSSFYAATTYAISCGSIPIGPVVQYYHDGANALPTIGDRIYLDSAGADLFDGGGLYYQISLSPIIPPPSGSGNYTIIESTGVVINEGSCVCTETAIPVVTPHGFVFTTNQTIEVQLIATNDPISWQFLTPCLEYTLNGGTTGTIFSVDDCEYGVQNVTVSINETIVVCSATAPTVVGGSGSVTLNGPCATFVLPNGISLDTSTGILSGTVADECDFSFDVTATNCFGVSLPETINISIVASSRFKPFLMDVENFGTTSSNACALTAPLYSVLYHNGVGDVPAINDLILRVYDAEGNATPFFGGAMWYVAYGTSDVLQICETGKVCDVYTCP